MKTVRRYKYLAIIPARGGSKRIPGKNLIDLGGHPLIYYTLKAAQDCKKLKKGGLIFISTDDEKIANYCRSQRIEVPSLRPKQLAGDKSNVNDVIVFILKNLKKEGIVVENVILLQPPSPFRRAIDLDKSIEIFEKTKADTLVSVKELADHPYWAWKKQNDLVIPFFTRKKMAYTRAEVPPAVMENGAIVIAKSSIIERTKILYGKKVASYFMDEKRSLDIDTPEELELARSIFSEIMKDKS